MARKFLTNIDLSKNQIQNVVIHKLASAPTFPTEGQVYYNTTDERWYLRQNSVWKDVTGRLDDILTGTNAITILDNNDGTLTIDIADATQTNSGLMSSADKTKLDNSTDAATANTLVERDADGHAAFSALTVNDAPINPTDAVNKQYVDNLTAGGVNIVGSIDASTNPNYPAADRGDAYYVSVDGKIGGVSGEDVHVGDLIVAVNDNAGGDEATVGNDWIVMERNQEYATEETAGYIEIATQVEVDAGTDDQRAVTPAKLTTYVQAQFDGSKHSALIGDSVATSYVVNHQLGTQEVFVVLYDVSTFEEVETDVIHTDNDNITLQFTLPPALDSYRVVIHK